MVSVAVDCHYARATGRFPSCQPAQEEHMQSQRLKLFQPTVVALAAALVIGSALRSSAQDYGDSSSRTLQGTWWVQVTALSDCVSRTPLISFSALLTFADGGTMTGTTTNPAFAIGQRTPDHGVWARRRAPHTFRASSVALILFTTAPNFPVDARIPGWLTAPRSDHRANRSSSLHERRRHRVLRCHWTEIPTGLCDGARRAVRMTSDSGGGAR